MKSFDDDAVRPMSAIAWLYGVTPVPAGLAVGHAVARGAYGFVQAQLAGDA